MQGYRRLLLTLTGTLLGSAASADTTRLTLGSYFSSGDYGGSTTTELQSLSFSVKHRRGPWNFKASLPYLWITSDGSVLPDGEPTGTSGSRSSRSGIGDLTLTVSNRIYYDKAARQGMRLRGKVKLPTADEDKALGSGEVDYTVELAPFKQIDDTTLYGALGFKIYGDTESTDYRDVWLARAGFMHKFNPRHLAALSTSYRQKTTATRDDKHTLMLFHSYRPDRAWRVQSFAIVGLSNAAADLAGGISLAHEF